MLVIKRARVVLAPLLLTALLFTTMFARITILACLSEKSKQISSLEAQAERAQVKISQTELVLSQLHDLEEIALRASQLGMKKPTGGQIRVLQINSAQNTPAERGHEMADKASWEEWD